MRFLFTILSTFFISSFLIAEEFSEYTDRGWDLLYYTDIGLTDSVVKILKEDVEVDFETDDGVTALMLASQSGYDDIILILIEYGADVNKRAKHNGITPLISAVRNNYLRTSELLIRNGADINDNDDWGRQAIHYAAMFGYVATADMLIYYAADINDSDAFGVTPIAYAVANKHNEIVDLLYRNGAYLLPDDHQPEQVYENSLLHLAAYSGNIYFVENYYEYFVDIVLYSKNHLSPVELAVVSGESEIAELLIDKSFYLRDTIFDIYTPLTLAKHSRDLKTIMLIDDLDYPDIHYPYFRRVGIGSGLLFNSDDYFWDFNLSLIEDRYGFLISAGYLTRGVYRKVLYQKTDNHYYQFSEKRHGTYLKIQKHFGLYRSENNYLGVFFQLMPTYFWGEYKGVDKNISTNVVNSLGAGISLNFKTNFRINFTYQNVDMNVLSIKNDFFYLGFKFTPSFRTSVENEKYRYIINY